MQSAPKLAHGGRPRCALKIRNRQMKDKHDSDRPVTRRSYRPTPRRFTGLPFGYICPAGAKSIEDIRKDPDAEPIYAEWFVRLEAGEGCHEVAGWLNSDKVPLGSPIARH